MEENGGRADEERRGRVRFRLKRTNEPRARDIRTYVPSVCTEFTRAPNEGSFSSMAAPYSTYVVGTICTR